jgi:hypothetical protein
MRRTPAHGSAGWTAAEQDSAASRRSDAVTTDEVREGEGRCLFDEISNLVEPLERPAMEAWAG